MESCPMRVQEQFKVLDHYGSMNGSWGAEAVNYFLCTHILESRRPLLSICLQFLPSFFTLNGPMTQGLVGTPFSLQQPTAHGWEWNAPTDSGLGPGVMYSRLAQDWALAAVIPHLWHISDPSRKSCSSPVLRSFHPITQCILHLDWLGGSLLQRERLVSLYFIINFCIDM